MDLFYKEVNSSIFASLLFPQKLLGNNMFDLDLTGLTGGMDRSQKITSTQIINRGTAAIGLAQQLFESEKCDNRVRLNGSIVEPTDYFEEIFKGLSDCFDSIYRNKKVYIEKIISNELLYGKFRQVLRPTHVYAKYLESTYCPNYLVAIEKVEHLLNIITESTHYKARTKMEFEELLNNDVPYFVCKNDENTLISGQNKKISNYFEQKPKSLVLNKFRRLTKEYIKKQKYYFSLSMSLYAHNSNRTLKNNALNVYDQGKGLNDSLIRLLKSTALRDERSGKCTWVLLDLENDERILSPMTPSYYLNGGIIWYLATAGEILKDEECTELAKGALKGLGDFQQPSVTEKEISAYAGKYSLIYLYYNLSVLWADNSLLKKAYQWIKELKSVNEASLEQIDYVNGLAGMIHLLTNIFERDKQAFILDTAVYLADKLSKKVTPIANSGLAHGCSGSALALASVYRFTRNPYYKEKIVELIQLENQLFDPKNGNWIDRRTDQSEINYWCYGAVGIVLARNQLSIYLNDRSFIDSSYYLEGLKTAVKSLKLESQQNMSLCHGLFGNLAALEPLMEQVEDPSLKVLYEKAEQEAQKIRAETNVGNVDQCVTLSFMLGFSGIGYELFRKEGVHLPSILNLSVMKAERGR